MTTNPTDVSDLEAGYVLDRKSLDHPLFDMLFAQSEMEVRIIVEQDRQHGDAGPGATPVEIG